MVPAQYKYAWIKRLVRLVKTVTAIFGAMFQLLTRTCSILYLDLACILFFSPTQPLVLCRYWLLSLETHSIIFMLNSNFRNIARSISKLATIGLNYEARVWRDLGMVGGWNDLVWFFTHGHYNLGIRYILEKNDEVPQLALDYLTCLLSKS